MENEINRVEDVANNAEDEGRLADVVERELENIEENIERVHVHRSQDDPPPDGAANVNARYEIARKTIRFPKYDATKTRSAEMWLIMVDSLISQHQMDDAEIIDSINNCLEGEPMDWLTTLHRTGHKASSTWVDFRAEYKERWGEKATASDVIGGLKKLQQQNNESVAQFYDRTVKVLNNILEESRPPRPPATGPNSVTGKHKYDAFMSAQETMLKALFTAGLRDAPRVRCEEAYFDKETTLERLKLIARQTETATQTQRAHVAEATAAPTTAAAETAAVNNSRGRGRGRGGGRGGYSNQGNRGGGYAGGQQYNPTSYPSYTQNAQQPQQASNYNNNNNNRGNQQYQNAAQQGPLTKFGMPAWIIMSDNRKLHLCYNCKCYGHFARACYAPRQPQVLQPRPQNQGPPPQQHRNAAITDDGFLGQQDEDPSNNHHSF